MASVTKTTKEYKVAKGKQAGYNAITNKDADTVYYCTDTGNIYLGTNLMFDPNAFNNVSSTFNATTKKITFSCHGPNGNVTATKEVDLSNFALKSEISSLVAGIEAGAGIDTKLGEDGKTTVFDVNVDGDTLVIDSENKIAINPTYTQALEQKISDSISTVYKYKGSCTYANLPSSGQAVGDVWNVTDSNGNVPAGTNYAWNGTTWDALGGAISLDGYATEDYVDTAVGNAKIFWNEITE